MRKIFLRLTAVMLLVNFLAAPAWAKDLIPKGMPINESYQRGIGNPIGTVVLAQGEVIIIHKDGDVGYRAREEWDLFKSDTVVCLDNSLAILGLADGSRISLASQTRLRIDRSVYDEKSGERSSFFNMALGKTRFWITKLADFKRSEVRVMTPTAILGVRGSDFIVEATQTTTRVSTLDDTLLEVINKILPERPPIILAAFQQSIVEGEAAPTPPVDITSDQAGEIVKGVPVTAEDAEAETEAAPADDPAKSSEGNVAAAASEKEILVEQGTLIQPAQTTPATVSTSDGTVIAPQPSSTLYEEETLVEDEALIQPEEIPEAILPQPEPPFIETFDSARQEQISDIQETQDSSLKEVQEENAVSRLPDFPKPPQ